GTCQGSSPEGPAPMMPTWVLIAAVRQSLEVVADHREILPRSGVGNFGVSASRREGRIPGDPIDLVRCIVDAGGQPPWPGIWSDRERRSEERRVGQEGRSGTACVVRS